MPRSSYVRVRAAVAFAANAAAKSAAAARVHETEVMKTGFRQRLDGLPVAVEIRQEEWSYIVTESFLQSKISSLACSLCGAETTLQTSDDSQLTGSFEVTCTACDNVANTSESTIATDSDGIVTLVYRVRQKFVNTGKIK